jgi:hypothetical protein
MKAVLFGILFSSVSSFQPTARPTPRRFDSSLFVHKNDENAHVTRRFLLGALSSLVLLPNAAFAGIDVSGLKADGGGSSALKEQLRAYDGSGITRVNDIKASKESSSKPSSLSLEDIGSTTTYAYRSAPGFNPKLQKLGFGERYRCEDQLVSPSGKGYLSVSFEFPSDWLQLDKMLGGIQYVDQRNGDKLYILKARLPPDTTLTTVPKKFFGESLFDPQGTISKGGIEVDQYKVSKSTILSDGSVSAGHRRLLLKYYTVTGNGLRTERRGLVDAYEVDGVAYMLFTGSNAVKFEANGSERETVENIVDSFRVEQVL